MAQAQANVFFKGEEKKFAINIEADGFSMDNNDFEIEVTNGKESISALKAGEPTASGTWPNEDGSLTIFYEGETTKNWFAIIDTQYFEKTGQLDVIGTAYIVDPKAYDGVRKSIDVATLGTLRNK